MERSVTDGGARISWVLAATLTGVLLTLVPSQPAGAEPWLSTRYAQNCSGCHAPGRKNKAAIARRCTLSCQGCHVNPNGGGLRSAYGKWNEDRWLRSFRLEPLEGAQSPSTIWEQRYGKEPWLAVDADKGEIEERGRAKGKDKDKEKARAKLKVEKKKRKLKVAEVGFLLVETPELGIDEDAYKRNADHLEYINATDEDDGAEFMYQIPRRDPYRLLGESKVDAGADLRWQVSSYESSGKKPEVESFLMSADFGVHWRPIYRNLHFVFETQFQGMPDDPRSWEERTQTSKTRSLYVMVDDLAWNVFVMGGFYRPLFGNFVPDHYSVAQEMTSYGMTGDSKNYNLLFKAISIGTAPNVPYANFHLVQKRVGDPEDRTRAAAANLGLRFVTLGASVNYSIWMSRDKRPDGTDASAELHSFDTAARLGPVVADLAAVSVKRDVKEQDLRQGGVISLDTYTRVWRENYFTLMYAKSNVIANLMPGEVVQLKSGLRSFLWQGVDVMVLYQNRHEAIEDPKTKEYTNVLLQGYEGQIHMYF